MSLRKLPWAPALLLAPVMLGCSSSASDSGAGGLPADTSTSAGGQSNLGGQSASTNGGAASVTATLGGTGGVVSATGSAAAIAGGAVGQGGSVSVGGSSIGGWASGGTVSAGGTRSAGGANAAGASAKGGAIATGGATANGGRAAGGSTSIGGKATGGANDSTGGASTLAGATSCPTPPSDAPASAITALDTVNAARLGMGVPCDSLVSALDASAQAHCTYYATNKGATDGCDSAPSPHSEISGCPAFTGADVGARIKAAGYSSRGYSECMAFLNNPTNAVMMFINSVYHRGPVLSPWMRDMGYGAATGCDTIDFGTGATTPNNVVAFYPYAGQTGVPLNFDGRREGPTPPAPSTGWPSGYPVTLYVQGATITHHEFIEESTGSALDHVFITPTTDPNKAIGNSVVLYGNAPLKTATTYRVNIQGTQTLSGTTTDLKLSWTFTTK